MVSKQRDLLSMKREVVAPCGVVCVTECVCVYDQDFIEIAVERCIEISRCIES